MLKEQMDTGRKHNGHPSLIKELILHKCHLIGVSVSLSVSTPFYKNAYVWTKRFLRGHSVNKMRLRGGFLKKKKKRFQCKRLYTSRCVIK